MRHVGKRHGTRRGGGLGARRYSGSKRNCRRTRRGGGLGKSYGTTTRYGGSKRNCRRTRRGGDRPIRVSDKWFA
jgi:hypothetical protein